MKTSSFIGIFLPQTWTCRFSPNSRKISHCCNFIPSSGQELWNIIMSTKTRIPTFCREKNQSRFTRFWGKISNFNFYPCKKFDILQLWGWGDQSAEKTNNWRDKNIFTGRPLGRYYRPLVDNRSFCLNGRYSWYSCGRYCMKMVDISSKSLRMVIDFPYSLKYEKSQDLKVY